VGLGEIPMWLFMSGVTRWRVFSKSNDVSECSALMYFHQCFYQYS